MKCITENPFFMADLRNFTVEEATKSRTPAVMEVISSSSKK